MKTRVVKRWYGGRFTYFVQVWREKAPPSVGWPRTSDWYESTDTTYGMDEVRPFETLEDACSVAREIATDTAPKAPWQEVVVAEFE